LHQRIHRALDLQWKLIKYPEKNRHDQRVVYRKIKMITVNSKKMITVLGIWKLLSVIPPCRPALCPCASVHARDASLKESKEKAAGKAINRPVINE
jgi:hypothetical protein